MGIEAFLAGSVGFLKTDSVPRVRLEDDVIGERAWSGQRGGEIFAEDKL